MSVLTLADSAIIKMSKAKDYLTFTLFKGSNYKETNMWKLYGYHIRASESAIRQTGASHPTSELRLPTVEGTPRFGDQVKAMKIKQLRHGKDSLEKDQAVATRAFIREMSRQGLSDFQQPA
jgi:hypothetical protein